MSDYQSILQRYQELTTQLTHSTNPSQFASLGQELAELKPLADLAQTILSLRQKIKEAQDIIAEKNNDSDLKLLARQELNHLQTQLDQAKQRFQTLAHQQQAHPQDKRPAILELRPAAGGEEAKIWAEDLKRMYTRFAESIGLTVSLIDDSTIKIKGQPNKSELPPGPYGIFKYEAGVHRVQRIPVTESQGRIHTSTATVAVLPQIKDKDIVIKDEDLEWQFFRSGGHGGQNVNKVNTAVRLKHLPTGITVVSTQERYQYRNKEIALQLLKAKLWQIEEEKRLAKIESKRQAAVGRGMRSEKIRTYNYPQNRVTDHRLNKSWYNLEEILNGDLTDIILALQNSDLYSKF